MYYIHLPYLKSFANEQRKPYLRTIPFVIQKDGLVYACNRLAHAKKIFPGMTLIDARKKSYSLTVVACNEHFYESAREHILEHLSEFVSAIEPDNGVSAFFESVRMQRPADREEYIQDIRATLQKVFQTEIQIGFGANKTIASIAGRLAQVNSQLIIDDFEYKEFISLVPISLLPGIGKRSSQLLAGIGIFSIGQIARLSPLMAIRLFGKSGLMLLQRANGDDARKIENIFKQKQIARTLHTRYAIESIIQQKTKEKMAPLKFLFSAENASSVKGFV